MEVGFSLSLSLHSKWIPKNDYIMISYWYHWRRQSVMKPHIRSTFKALERLMRSCLATLSRWKSPCCPSRNLVEEQSLPPCWILSHTCTHTHTETPAQIAVIAGLKKWFSDIINLENNVSVFDSFFHIFFPSWGILIHCFNFLSTC